MIGAAIVEAMENLGLAYPKVDAPKRARGRAGCVYRELHTVLSLSVTCLEEKTLKY
jgi:hypothetical protein